MDSLIQDLRYAVRMLFKNPGFTAIAVFTLALGIGANTAIFSMVDAVLLKKLPVKDTESLVLFNWEAGKAFRNSGNRGIFVGGFAEGRRGGSSFLSKSFETLQKTISENPDSPVTDLFAFADLSRLNLAIDGSAEVKRGQVVSGNYFSAMGVNSIQGRVIGEADDDPAAQPVAVLSYRYWQDRFASDPAAIGKQILINKNSFTIIGVTPPEFNGSSQVDDRPAIFVPIATQAILEERPMADRPGKPGVWWLHLMGRMKKGATLEQARESLNSAFQSEALAMMPPPRNANEPAQLEVKDYPQLVTKPGARGMWEVRSIYASRIYLLFGVVGFVLLIACANVANLLLARAAIRSPEITIRLAVGAGRWRLIRQLLTESVLLSAMGGAVGVVFALWGKDALVAISDGQSTLYPVEVSYQIDWRVLAFTVLLSFLTGIIFGMAPAWRASNKDLTSSLKESGRSSMGTSRSRLSKGLIIAQVALSLVLLVGAGLFVRTLLNLQKVDVGFNQENLLTFTLQPGANGYKKERLVEFYKQLFERVEANPGVRAITFGTVPLIAHYINDNSLILPGETTQTPDQHITNVQEVRENYFSTMEIPLLQGRNFGSQDSEKAPKVAIVSQLLAEKFFPGENPIGKRVGFDEETLGKIEIIGIVRDITYNSQREERAPMIYLPWLQATDTLGEMSFAVRTVGEPTASAAAIRQTISEMDNTMPIREIKTQVKQSQEALAEERLYASLIGFFSLLSVLLSAIGLYGVLAYSVTQRFHEIGIRRALGANTGDVLRLIIWQGVKLVLIGLLIGGAGVFALTRIIENQLYNVSATDPLTISIVGGFLLMTALFACWIPAYRATKVDPMVALRYE
ncbi:MAG: ABC transporter permease [Acidobacteriota bacterium]